VPCEAGDDGATSSASRSIGNNGEQHLTTE